MIKFIGKALREALELSYVVVVPLLIVWLSIMVSTIIFDTFKGVDSLLGCAFLAFCVGFLVACLREWADHE